MPDLMPFVPADEWLAEVRKRMVELPLARKQRFMRDYLLTKDQAETFKSDVEAGDYFEKCAAELLAGNPSVDSKALDLRGVANTVIQQYRPRLLAKNRSWAALAPLIPSAAGVTIPFLRGVISSVGYQQVIDEMFETGRTDPDAIISEKGLKQVSDTGAIEKFCDEVIAANPGPVADFKNGKTAALNFLKGQVMKLSKGRANPALAGQILENKLKS